MNTIQKSILFLFVFTSISISQTITSKSTGGHWNSASTWEGGVVPGNNADVVINGLVVVSNETCNNLTINSSGIIEDEPSAGRTINVNGNFINNGTVRIGAGNAGVDLYVDGSVENYGTLIHRTLRFSGAGTQTFKSTTKISCSLIEKYPDGKITAASDITIDSVTTVNISSDIFDMGSYKLTKISRKDIDNSDNIIKGGTVLSNGLLDISGRYGSNLDGNFTLTGSTPMLFTGSNVVEKNLHIGAGKTIADEPSAGRTITVNGNLINEGFIKNRFAGLTINVFGNVANNGEYTAYLRFSGNDNQTISGSKIFSCSLIDKYPDGKITAASDITIDSITTVNLSSDVLDMGSYKLTKISRKDIDNSSNIISGGTLASNGLLDISGRFGSDLDGNFTLTGSTPLLFTGNNVVKKNLKVGAGKSIADEPSAGRTITVNGNLINEGIIQNRFAGLTIFVLGNVINDGEYTAYLRFSGNDDQTISGSKIFSCSLIDKYPDGKIKAASNISMDSVTTINLTGDILDMGIYKLTKISRKDIDNSSNIINYGTVISNSEIDVEGRFGSNLQGNFILTGSSPMLFTGGNIISNDLKIAAGKIIQDECCAGREFTVMGNIYNYGTIKNRYGGLTVNCYGSVYNFGTLEINTLYLRSSDNKLMISGVINSNISLTKSGGSYASIEIDGYLFSNNQLTVGSGVVLTIPGNSELNLLKSVANSGSIINKGTFKNRYYIYSGGNVTPDKSLNLSAHVYDRAQSDSLEITSENGSSYPNMSSSIKRWWRINGNKSLNSYSVDLIYDESILNGQDPSKLEAYLTTDGGNEWKKISNPLNTIRDPANKTISVGNSNYPISLTGDIILSTGSIVNITSISSAISGRKQIRVGPPNRYTVSYWNNTDLPTSKFFMKLETNRGVHIKSVFTTNIEDGKAVELPIDSLTYDGQNEQVYLLVQELNPKELRSFDVVLTSDLLGKQSATMEPITFTAVALWIVGAAVEEFVSNTIVEGCYEMWRPVRNDESLYNATKTALKNSVNKAVTVENGVKGIAKKGATEIIEKTGKAVVWPVALAKDLYDCMGNMVNGMKDYVNGNFDKQSLELTKVTSWDPNAKEGPGGFGTQGFIATSSPMSYTIYFENKKEATAPAYEIVVLDTLDDKVFDINSVQFGSMSHNMGVATQQGNVLKWKFTAIELVPNVTPPEGEGWVKFVVNPKPNLPTGTILKNKAVITFDVNKPLATNDAINTLDFDIPVTTIQSVQNVSGKHEVQVTWTASDASGSGIKNSSIFMASGDGPFSQVATSTASSVNIPVSNNSSYKFFVLSTDNVGNSEKEPGKILDIITSADKEANTISKEFVLSQNYPNPFNPTTTIHFSLPKSSKIILEVFNILGEKISKLIDSEMEAGNHYIKFDGSKLSSGIYFYQIKSDQIILAKKMMLIK